MNILPRELSMFAAVAATLWFVSPAMAAEINPPGKEVAGVASVKTASAPARRHPIWPRYRVAAWYTSRLYYPDVAPVGWQGYFAPRPFVLMVGVAY